MRTLLSWQSSTFLFGLMLFTPAAAVTASDSADPVNFNRDVRRILATRCLGCHGPDEQTREAGLRLDQRLAAFEVLESGHRAIVAGRPEESELIRRIKTTDDGERMPPADLGPGLSEAECAVLERWIAEGASFEEHWSFVAPKWTAPPHVDNPDWAQNLIDRFILSRLTDEGLHPQTRADRYRLIRRLTLDLTGLPPTIEEADQFVRDESPDAYDKVVDRLLSSPRFGERWGRVWLDLARYADSQGYAQDSERNIWRYRDWVIQALNSGMTFDQFTIEQLAGDLLPDPSTDQLIATAFHRNTMTNSEGGTNDEEFRNAAVVDRVNTTMEVWMGLTMACAQCHSHKYDPISHQEYFGVFAIFNQTQDQDRPDETPLLSEYTDAQLRERAALLQQISEAEAAIAACAPAVSNASPVSQPPSGPLDVRFVRIESLGEKIPLHVAEVQIFAGNENIALKGVARQSSTAFEGEAGRAIDGNTNGDYQARSVTHTETQENPWWEVELPRNAAPVERVVVWNRTDNNLHTRLANWRVLLLDPERRPLFVASFTQPPAKDQPVTVPPDSERFDEAQRAALATYLEESGFGLSPAELRLRTLRSQLKKIQPEITTPIMAERPADEQRTTHIQLRGNYQSLGEEVQPGFPALLPSPPGIDRPTRMDLAQWLISDQNPLTARVVVNRHWEQLFGIGLVETSEDFGTQGELPSYPQLLDNLAIELMRHGWDTKWLLREIVTSNTYQQSSRASKDLEARDPHNRLLARGPRFRLAAEMIRDQALAVSGLLSDKMLGPSVQPNRPKLGLRAAFGGSTDWDTSPGEDQYRRGLYTKWRRTAPYPSMITFDAPSREFCTIRRSRTNTPLQALVTLNDPVYVEAAQALARRVLREPAVSINDRLNRMFRSVLVRPANSQEITLLRKSWDEALRQFQADPVAAGKLATEPLGPTPRGMDVAELAAGTVVANIILNLDETLARP